MFQFSANVPGSGKTILAEAPGVIFNGQEPGVMSGGQNEDEMRKKLTSFLAQSSDARDGGYYLLLDNIKGRLSSEALEGFLTAKVWRDRLLGSNRMGSWENNAIVAVTANNLVLSPDLARRQLTIRLESDLPNPSARELPSFKNTLLDNRSQLIWALLVLVQNWLAKGCPKTTRRLGSFDDWSANLGGILEGAGIGSDFLLKTENKALTIDEPWEDFVRAWQSSPTVGLQRQKTSELLRFADSCGILLADKSGNGSGRATALGRKLQRLHTVPFETPKGLVRLVGESYGNGTVWTLVPISKKNAENDDKSSKSSNNPDSDDVVRGGEKLQTQNSKAPKTLISSASLEKKSSTESLPLADIEVDL
jgi:hypothetical protein